MRHTAVAIILGFCLFATACGGSSPTAPSAPPPAPTSETQTVTGSVGGFTGAAHPLTIARRGNLTLELTWPGSADLDIYLTDTACTDIYQQRTCQIFGQADSFAQNPERVTRTAAAGDRYSVWIVNASGTSANYTLVWRHEFTSTAPEPALTAGEALLGPNQIATAAGRLK